MRTGLPEQLKKTERQQFNVRLPGHLVYSLREVLEGETLDSVFIFLNLSSTLIHQCKFIKLYLIMLYLIYLTHCCFQEYVNEDQK